MHSIFSKQTFLFYLNIWVTNRCTSIWKLLYDESCACTIILRLHLWPSEFARQFKQLFRGKIWDQMIQVLGSKSAISAKVDLKIFWRPLNVLFVRPILFPPQWIMRISGGVLRANRNRVVGYNCSHTIPRIPCHKMVDDSWPRWSWFEFLAYMW
jgi:hypothetical protein